MVKAFVGYRSTLTDVWTDIVLLLWTDPVHSFLMDFSIRMWKALLPHIGIDQETPGFQLSSCTVVTQLFST